MNELRSYLTSPQIIVALGLTILVLLGASLARSAIQSAPSWKVHVEWVDQALAAHQINAAVVAWRDAYGAAVGSRDWEAMLAVGEAALRISNATEHRVGWEGKARQCFLSALFRARDRGSVEGVLRVASAFAKLGDRDVVEQSLRIAERLAGEERNAQTRVREGTVLGAVGPAWFGDEP